MRLPPFRKGVVGIASAIIIAGVIIGAFYFATQVSKQKSIERQQSIQIQEERVARAAKEEQEREQHEAVLREERAAREVKDEQERKKYAADQKSACLAIYKTEGAKWNNVNGWRYDEENDECYIQYKEAKPKSKDECDKLYPLEGYGVTFFRLNFLCKDGLFESSF